MDKAQLKKDLTAKIENTLKVLDNELKGLRTGRASIHLLDPVVAEVYGSRTPLSQVASISVSDAKTIAIQVWDNKNVKAVEKGIADAQLGLNPLTEGNIIRLILPQLTEDRRKELVKFAHKYGENSKVAIRNIRRDAMEEVKKAEKASVISEDEQRKLSTEIQKIIDEHIAKIDTKIKQKEQEIMTI